MGAAAAASMVVSDDKARSTDGMISRRKCVRKKRGQNTKF
jgi:hypothetical protein